MQDNRFLRISSGVENPVVSSGSVQNIFFAGKFSREAHPPIARRLYDMGDIHFNNHRHKVKGAEVKIRRPKVVEELNSIGEEHDAALRTAQKSGQPPPELSLVLNGDIIDLTDSWPTDVDLDDIAIRSQTTLKVINEIAANNPEAFKALRRLLKRDHIKIYFVLGNHDRWLTSPQAQDYLRSHLGKNATPDKLVFSREFYDPDMKIMAIHGDQFDPYCGPPEQGLNTAEKLDILVVKRLLSRLPKRLLQANYPPHVVKTAKNIIRSIEYVRPVDKAFVWGFEELKKLSQAMPNIERKRSVLAIAMEEALNACGEAQKDALPFRAAMMQSRLIQSGIRAGVDTWLGRTFLGWQLSNMVNKVRGDHNQLKSAIEYLKTNAGDKDVRVLILGHTHKILDKTVRYEIDGQTRETRIMNPGSFKATILYPDPRPVYPAGFVKAEWRPEQLEVSLNVDHSRVIATV